MPGAMLCHGKDAVSQLFTGKNEQDRRVGIERMRSSSNAGLVWSRYLDIWNGGSLPELVDGTARREVLDTFVRDFNARTEMAGSAAVRLLGEVHLRQERVIGRHGGEGRTFRTTLATRFATGLGSPHPTELGFTFERSNGIPYLPGSSVKGLARAAAKLSGEPEIEALFGPERIERGSKTSQGRLTFLDAYPTTWPRLETDVINCHHPQYYIERGLPLETDDPIPVYFLTVATGTQWTFHLVGRSAREADRGVELLRFGLRELGAGAKTAVGYGAFSE